MTEQLAAWSALLSTRRTGQGGRAGAIGSDAGALVIRNEGVDPAVSEPDRDVSADLELEEDDLPGGRHSESVQGVGKGTWLQTVGVERGSLAGKVVTVAAYKGGMGKTFLAYELAYLLGAVLIDLDWDRGNASRAWGYREERRVGAVLLDALQRGRAPRPLAGGHWRPDLVPCTAEFGTNQPGAERLTDAISQWAGQWGREQGCPVVIDTHPGAQPSTFAAAAAAHAVVVPVILGQREMEATEGMVEELGGYPLLLTPNRVPVSPPDRFISWLERIARDGHVPVLPAISDYRWLTTRQRRMAVSATDPTPARARQLVDELHAVAMRVVRSVGA